MRGKPGVIMPCSYKINYPLLQSAERLFRDCGKDVDFMNKYIINSVLSYIEEREQDLVLGMQYNDWIIIDKKTRDEIKERIVEFIRRFVIACGKANEYGEKYFDELRDEIDEKNIIEKSLCYLYVFGIYGDCISRYILIKPPEGTQAPVPDYDVSSGNVNDAIKAFNDCISALKTWDGFSVRSRFIEIIRDLYLLKQRFLDISTFESHLLVDRVFAYAHPRILPLGIYDANYVCNELKTVVQNFFNAYHDYLVKSGNINDNDFDEFWNIFCEFLQKAFKDIRFYRFQIKGIKSAIMKLTDILKSTKSGGREKIDYLVISAPTGSGKTEIMVLTILIVALARKIILLMHKFNDDINTPVALIVYPRRSLANDQVSRFMRYMSILNDIISKRFGNGGKLTMTINYTEVRWRDEYNEAISKAINGNKNRNKREIPLTMRYGVFAYLIWDGKDYYVELRFLTCPESGGGTAYPRFRVITNGNSYKIDDSTVYCNGNQLDFIALTKDRVKERLGDVHITIFETLRRNLLMKSFNNLFGTYRKSDNYEVFDYPLIIVLDEIHTYIDVPGVRYAYTLRRILNRIRYNYANGHNGEPPGHLIIGMSATIPHPEDFLSNLFFENINERNRGEYIIEVDKDETIPLGTEYFIITVPTRRAPVNALTVSIQTIMDVFYNIPAIPKDNEYVKRAIVFVEEFNVLRRMRRKLHDEDRGAIYRIDQQRRVFGLQDLRNPRNQYLFQVTINDYGDNQNIVNNYVSKGMVSRIVDTKSWLDGELWWGYMLDTIINYYQSNPSNFVTTKFNNVIEYSSRGRGNIRDAAIIVSTSALEVGIDYSDVVFIYQHGAPPNIASLIQRAGRSGRRFFENPLMRAVVGIQLSPDLPNQSWLFGIFTRVKNLRDALNYDRLFLPMKSKELQKQTFAELALEYYILTNKLSKKDLSGDWECKFYNWLNQNKKAVIKYSQWVFGERINENDLNDFIGDIIKDLTKECENQSKGKANVR